MTANAGLAALWLSAGLAAVVFALALRRPTSGVPAALTLGSVAAVQAGLSALALAASLGFAPSRAVVAVAAWQLVLATAIATMTRSRWHRRGQPAGLIVLASVMLALDGWLLARSPAVASGSEDSAVIYSWAAMHGGLAALTVAAIVAVAGYGRIGTRVAVAVRPWALTAWIALTLAVLLASVGASGAPPWAAIASWLAASAFVHLIGWRPQASRSRAPMQRWGAAAAHGGIAVALGGLAASFALAESRSVVLHEAGRVTIGPWLVQLNSVTPTAGSRWVALEGELEASRGAGAQRLEPERRYPFGANGRAEEVPATRALWAGRLGAAMGAQNRAGGWPIRLSWRPFTGIIWLGLGLALFGGTLVAAARGWRQWRRRPDTNWRRRSYG